MPDSDKSSRQYVRFHFFSLDRAWLQLPADEQRAQKDEFAAAVRNFGRRMLLRCYSTVGIRGDVDFMLWEIAMDPLVLQDFDAALRQTRLRGWLDTPESFFAQTKRSIYDIPGDEDESEDIERLVIDPGQRQYLFIYPFLKTRAWYALSQDERQEMISEHIVVGRKYPDIRLNTTYSFGLDDQEFVVAFEGDDPSDFLDLVMDLRFTKASEYTLRDTPTFTCTTCTLNGMLDLLGGPPLGEAAAAEAEQWHALGPADEIAEGEAQLYFVGAKQLAVFRVAGELYAIDNRCPHSRGPLNAGEVKPCEGEDEHPCVACPWHDSTFDLVTGAAQPGSITQAAVATYSLELRDGIVHVLA